MIRLFAAIITTESNFFSPSRPASTSLRVPYSCDQASIGETPLMCTEPLGVARRRAAADRHRRCGKL